MLSSHLTGMMSATASLGLILLWDVDGGLTQIDKFLYSSEDYIKVSFEELYYCQHSEVVYCLVCLH